MKTDQTTGFSLAFRLFVLGLLAYHVALGVGLALLVSLLRAGDYGPATMMTALGMGMATAFASVFWFALAHPG